MAKFGLLLVALFLNVLIVAMAQEPIVQTADGLVQGITKFATYGRPYTEFLGIPFAQPPIGNLRFAAPVPASSWTGIRNSADAPLCIQTLIGNGTIGKEDCLYLNVYSPQLPNATVNPNFPVMVWLYGGGYNIGGSESYYYGTQRFMNKDVVYVTLNYRLSAFGFLSTADAVAPGNFGMLDQVLALKWVQKNIAAFGGNPGQVTIQGQSAGSSSVSYLIISPAATGLFHAAIGESGSSLCPWALQKYPMNFTRRFADVLACPTDDTTLMIDCLRTKTADEIVFAAWDLGEYTMVGQQLVPVVEDPSYGQFLTDWPLNILDAGTFNKVPVLTGCNKNEGDLIYGRLPEVFDVIDDHFFDVLLPDSLYFLFKYNHNLINVSYAIKAEYYDKIDVNNDAQRIGTSIDFLTDAAFLAPNDLNVRKLAASGLPIYTYIFAYPGASFKNFSGTPEISHGDELPYLFKIAGIDFRDENKTAVSDVLIDLWTSFAINFNPTPSGYPIQWASSPASQVQYLYIYDTSDMNMVFNYRSEQMYFWNNIVPDILLA